MTFTRQQVRALNHLAPIYKAMSGKSDEEKELFLEQTYLIWSDYCPIHRSLDMEQKEFEWKKLQHKNVRKICMQRSIT